MDPINAALAILEPQDPPNYTQTAKEFNINRTTLSWRYRRITRAREDATEMKSLLLIQQERTPLRYINLLTKRVLPPTTQMVQNFTFKILRITPKKNQVLQFIKRYKNKIKLSYLALTNIVYKRANNLYQYKLFYKLLKEKIKKYKIKIYNIYNITTKEKRRRAFTVPSLKRPKPTKRTLRNTQRIPLRYIHRRGGIC